MKYSNLIPLGENFLVQRKAAATESAGGIIIPDLYTEATQEATIIRAGTGKHDSPKDWELPLDLSVGDRVLINKYGGVDLSDFGGERLLIIPVNAILGFLDDRDSLWPVGDQLLIRLEERKEASEGGIILPQHAQGASRWGTIKRYGSNYSALLDTSGKYIVRRVHIGPTQGTIYQERGRDYIIINRNALQLVGGNFDAPEPSANASAQRLSSDLSFHA